MTVRFYCDLQGPLPIKGPNPVLYAATEPGSACGAGTTRVAFDVEFPEGYLREADVVVPASWVAS